MSKRLHFLGDPTFLSHLWIRNPVLHNHRLSETLLFEIELGRMKYPTFDTEKKPGFPAQEENFRLRSFRKQYSTSFLTLPFPRKQGHGATSRSRASQPALRWVSHNVASLSFPKFHHPPRCSERSTSSFVVETASIPPLLSLSLKYTHLCLTKVCPC